MRTTTHLVRRGACAAALALLAVGAASAPALAAAASPTTLAPSDGVGGDLFGESTATSATGAVTVVGAPEHHSSGAAYVFTRSGTTFSQSAELFPGNPLADEQFGQTVAISGNGQTLVAAAPGAAGPGVSDQGAAYVFSDASGSWTQIAELTALGASGLGTSLAISSDGSTIVAGAPLSNSDNGEAFVFTKSGSTYVRAQKLTVPASQSLALLGTDTAISSNGSTIAFGEPQNGVTDVFTQAAGASTWKQTAQLHGGGDSVAVSSSRKIVAPLARPASATSAGLIRVHQVRRHLHRSQRSPPARQHDQGGLRRWHDHRHLRQRLHRRVRRPHRNRGHGLRVRGSLRRHRDQHRHLEADRHRRRTAPGLRRRPGRRRPVGLRGKQRHDCAIDEAGARDAPKSRPAR